MLITLLRYVLYFFYYSALGWAFESTYCSIGERKLINRGFLTGPMCPIYGTGATVMAVFLYNPFKDKPMVVFLLGMVLCDIVEYMTSLIMEKLFNARWWNYDGELLNLHGRICFKHTLYWGVASVLFVKTIHSRTEALFSKIPDNYVIFITCGILVIFIIDVIFAALKAMGINKLRLLLSQLKEAAADNVNDTKQMFGDTYITLRLAAEGKYDSILSTIEEQKNRITETLDKGNDKMNMARDEVIFRAQLHIQQFEEKMRYYTKYDEILKKRKSFLREYKKKIDFKTANVKKLYSEIKAMVDDVTNSGNRRQ